MVYLVLLYEHEPHLCTLVIPWTCPQSHGM